jgi:serine/threonine protein kinase
MDPAAQGLVAGRFLIKREVGRGAAGIVYQASDRQTNQEVALKVIAASGADLVEQARFTREGQVLENLDHPGIVRVIAFGTLDTTCIDGQGRRLEEGSPYIAMEWLDGEDLQSRQRRAPLDLRQSLDVAFQLASALAAAHDAGIVHRDIKPSNIFLLDGSAESPASGVVVGATRPPEGTAPRLRIKLVDFGVAASNDVRLTKTGAAGPTCAATSTRWRPRSSSSSPAARRTSGPPPSPRWRAWSRRRRRASRRSSSTSRPTSTSWFRGCFPPTPTTAPPRRARSRPSSRR